MVVSRLVTSRSQVLVIVTGVLGNFFLSLGMKTEEQGAVLLAAFLNPWVVLGIALLVLWTLSRLTLLSWADLSYVLPVTALGYVLAALMGSLFLGEYVSPGRWAGIVLIVAGVSLVEKTPIRTTVASRPEERS